jgi:nuclear cap-binding protein subunit 1
MKIPFVAAAALAAHNLKPELGSEMLSKASNALQKYIDSGSWREAKLLLRFLGGLQSAFEGDGIFPLLEELFARAVDLQTTSSEDVSDAPFLCPRLRSNTTEYSCSDWSLSRSFCSQSPT